MTKSLGAADRYAEMRTSAKVRERPHFASTQNYRELEWQARWFAGDFGRELTGVAGEKIELVQFGVWNREAGPDFSEAAARIDGELARGSIEFDLAAENWETHGHATNPAFEETILHVFLDVGSRQFFSRTKSHRNVVQVRVDPAAAHFSLTNNLPLARPGRCQAPLRDLPNEKVCSILDAAAQFRLQRKARRLQQLSETHGEEEALFQELAAALGYKQNKLPFTLLAQRLPLKMLRAAPNECEAMLFGVAGFLEAPDLANFEAGTRSYLRGLWDTWWKRRGGLERLILPPRAWRLNGTRPLNHPQRRLAALAILATNWTRFLSSLGNNDFDAVREFFRGCAHPYWSFHYTLTSTPRTKAMALIGETRITEILVNVILPFFSSRAQARWPDYEKLPARLTNRRLETGAARLFGDDPRRKTFLRTAAHQQGLLQIYEDFCLPDNSDCAQCPFPEQMRKWI